MSYKWKPSKAQKRQFAEKMANDSEFSKAYYERKEAAAAKRRSDSKFDYNTAGGSYVPTATQNAAAFNLLYEDITAEQAEAANMVILGFACNAKVDHDFIHIVNEFIRTR